MRNSNFIEGMQILQKYCKPTGYDINAEHDIVYHGTDSADISPEDREQLIALGWFVDSEADCWAAFV